MDAAADDAERVLLPMGASPLLSLAQLTRGVGALGEGRHADAFAALRRIYEPGDVAHHRYIGWWATATLHSPRKNCASCWRCLSGRG